MTVIQHLLRACFIAGYLLSPLQMLILSPPYKPQAAAHPPPPPPLTEQDQAGSWVQKARTGTESGPRLSPPLYQCHLQTVETGPLKAWVFLLLGSRLATNNHPSSSFTSPLKCFETSAWHIISWKGTLHNQSGDGLFSQLSSMFAILSSAEALWGPASICLTCELGTILTLLTNDMLASIVTSFLSLCCSTWQRRRMRDKSGCSTTVWDLLGKRRTLEDSSILLLLDQKL